jgi:hypothetical protein
MLQFTVVRRTVSVGLVLGCALAGSCSSSSDRGSEMPAGVADEPTAVRETPLLEPRALPEPPPPGTPWIARPLWIESAGYDADCDVERMESLLEQNCGLCHDWPLIGACPDCPGNEYTPIDFEQLIEIGLVKPGNAADSLLLLRVLDGSMPPTASEVPRLSDASVAELQAFIDELDTAPSPSCKPAIPVQPLDNEQDLWPPLVPSVVWVECLRGHAARDAPENKFLETCEVIEELGEPLARRAAQLRRYARRGSAVDATCVALAERGGTMLTCDPVDLEALAGHAQRVKIERV